ncbi:MAG: adenylyltransferase [Acidimicrobiaceae bacterium]|nr:adenylyltransferase [Acidimicrobiaceae bacterium]
MTGLDRIWAGWRSEYIESTGDADDDDDGGGGGGGCVLCRVVAEGSHLIWRGDTTAVVLNAYPYTSGHLMVLPVRHVGELEEVVGDEAAELWGAVADAVRALKAAYRPEGINVGANLGRAAGAGVPGHFHVHALPRWNGDTNFMTAVAEARVMPETLSRSAEKLRSAWPH